MPDLSTLVERFIETRRVTEDICRPLAVEDYIVQPVEDVSPPKWHLGHTSWFFETLVLMPYKRNYRQFDKDFPFLFNSYYESLGARLVRTNRGNITRPGVSKVYEYRNYITEQVVALFFMDYEIPGNVRDLVDLGIHHEQQHQELLITDIKYILGTNPLMPAYHDLKHINNKTVASKPEYLPVEEGIYETGFRGSGFCYDNELGMHKTFLHAFRIMNRLVTNEEYMEFIESGAYKDHRFWLMDGFEWVKANNITAPLYWHKVDGKWHYYDLSGMTEAVPESPVTHISYYEADAFARWKGKRLPTELEWEAAARKYAPETIGNFLESGLYSPVHNTNDPGFFGNAWEWTSSSYLPYPFYKREEGPLGEYNGKFMVNQMVLRGGSCATPQSHIRHSYRNFFQPDKRWQFTGIRLAEYID